MRIIVDVMSGDNAPDEIIKGAYAASQEFNASFILVGDQIKIEEVAYENGFDIRRFEIVPSYSVLTMEDDPLSILHAKSNSSMATALRLLAEGKGDACVSAGNSGALFTGATLIVRKIRGVRRAAIGSVLPFKPLVLLIDSGANLEATEEMIEQFAVLGSAYMKKCHGVVNPRVGLLNNGTEECKGTELRISTYKRLSEAGNINFVGNVEANQLPFDVCDVVVTDGFSGNILLKSIEGMGSLMMNELKDLFLTSNTRRLAALLIKKYVLGLKKQYDPNEYGGAPILGISKPVIKAHGSSNAKAIKNAVKQAIGIVESGVTYDIAEEAEKFEQKRRAEIAARHIERNIEDATETSGIS